MAGVGEAPDYLVGSLDAGDSVTFLAFSRSSYRRKPWHWFN